MGLETSPKRGLADARMRGYSGPKAPQERHELVRRGLLKGITARMLVVSVLMTLVLGAAFVLLIVAVGGQRDAAKLALRSQEAITAGSELQKSVITLENGLRGFVATGKDRSLEPWRSALRQYPAQARRLAALVSDEPAQQATVRQITSDIGDYVNLWGRPLLALARDRLPAARSVIVAGTGRDRIDMIRASFGKLFAQERAVATSREHRAEGRTDLAIGAGIGGLGLLLIVAAALALFLRRFVVRPVLTLSGASRALADGDMSVRVPSAGGDEIGELARAFNTMADSLERSRREVAEHAHELERSNEELDRFAAVTSHDLQAPLATISMYVALLEQRHGAELGSATQLVDGISSATGHARDLIRGLLEYSRAGRGELRCEPVSSERMVTEVLEALAGPIEEAGATVSVGPLPVVSADRRSLGQVFQNLIANAVKFSEGEPRVSVSASRVDGSWWFAVEDNGIGMDPSDAEEIFEPFHRLHGEGSYPGTGIGLAVCERIVEQHGGRIWAESEPGRGSTFRFTLPAEVGATAPATHDEAALA
jgi:signal transduction histidine kinase